MSTSSPTSQSLSPSPLIWHTWNKKENSDFYVPTARPGAFQAVVSNSNHSVSTPYSEAKQQFREAENTSDIQTRLQMLFHAKSLFLLALNSPGHKTVKIAHYASKCCIKIADLHTDLVIKYQNYAHAQNCILLIQGHICLDLVRIEEKKANICNWQFVPYAPNQQ